MAKLIYRTKPPRKGYINHESFMTHETTHFRDKLPPNDIQNEAHEIVSDAMRNLIEKLDALGYDQTKVRFLIHFKD